MFNDKPRDTQDHKINYDIAQRMTEGTRPPTETPESKLIRLLESTPETIKKETQTYISWAMELCTIMSEHNSQLHGTLEEIEETKKLIIEETKNEMLQYIEAKTNKTFGEIAEKAEELIGLTNKTIIEEVQLNQQRARAIETTVKNKIEAQEAKLNEKLTNAMYVIWGALGVSISALTFVVLLFIFK